MAYNAGDRRNVRQAEKSAKLVETQNREVITGLMSVTNGRAWMWDWLTKLHIFQSPFHPDSGIMSFQCGEQNIGLQLLKDIMLYSPDQYILMAREANERNASSERARSQDADRRDQGREPSDATDTGDIEVDSDDGSEDRASLN